MKFTIKGGEEMEVELSLEKLRGETILVATDYCGRTWNVMMFESGVFSRFDSLPDDIGIEVDDKGRIIEDN